MGYDGSYTIGQRFVAESIGTLFITYLSLSAMANSLLPKNKGHGMGFAWLALAFGVSNGMNFIALYPVGEFFNPGMVLGNAIAGKIDWMDVPILWSANFLGAFLGAILDEIRRDALQVASYSSTLSSKKHGHAFQNTMRDVRRYLKYGPVMGAHNSKNRRRNSVQIGEINRRHCIDPDFKDAKQQAQLKKLERGNSIVVADLKKYLERLEELEKARQIAMNAPLPDKKEHQADNKALLESEDLKEYTKELDLTAMADQNVKLSVFATRPALYSPWSNLFCEIMFFKGFYMAMLIFGIIVGLGGPTGPAMNAARDFSPRLVHFLFPISGKGVSEWEYAWVPFVGNMIGGGIGGALWTITRFAPTR